MDTILVPRGQPRAAGHLFRAVSLNLTCTTNRKKMPNKTKEFQSMPLVVPNTCPRQVPWAFCRREEETRFPAVSRMSQLLKHETKCQKCLHPLSAQDYSTQHSQSSSFKYFPVLLGRKKTLALLCERSITKLSFWDKTPGRTGFNAMVCHSLMG